MEHPGGQAQISVPLPFTFLERVRKLAEKPFIFAHPDPQCELYLGSVPSGGFSFEWFAKLHNISMEQFFELAASVSLSDTLPIFLPYILGRGAPYMDYSPSGAWFGLSATHTLAELCRATVFGALCPLRQCTDLLEELSGKRENLILQALACREDAVRSTACSFFRQKKFLAANSEASLSGAAIIGFTALGEYADIKTASANMIRKEEIIFSTDHMAQNHYCKFLEYVQTLH